MEGCLAIDRVARPPPGSHEREFPKQLRPHQREQGQPAPSPCHPDGGRGRWGLWSGGQQPREERAAVRPRPVAAYQ
eukprot:8133535-Pyramimonas_sp.AAC.1